MCRSEESFHLLESLNQILVIFFFKPLIGLGVTWLSLSKTVSTLFTFQTKGSVQGLDHANFHIRGSKVVRLSEVDV